MERAPITWLRAVLLALTLLAVPVQVLLPATGVEAADQFAETAGLGLPYAIAAVLAIGCVQVALLALRRLLGALRSESEWDPEPASTPALLPPLTTIRACAVAAAALTLAVLLHLTLVRGVPQPGLLGGLTVITLIGVAVALLATVVQSHLAAPISQVPGAGVKSRSGTTASSA